MIQINLIPDIKQEFLRTQRTRNMVIAISIFVMLGSVAVLVLLGAILGAEAVREGIANRDIKEQYAKLRSFENIDNLVTIQNQLANISSANDSKLVTSRVFDVVTAVNPSAPNDIKMAIVDLDPAQQSILLEGSAANSFTATDIMKKTILNTKIEYTKDGEVQRIDLADEVLLSDTSYGENAEGQKVLRFKMSFKYPMELFDNKTTGLTIVSPTGRVDVTDSKIQVPDNLFAPRASDIEEKK